VVAVQDKKDLVAARLDVPRGLACVVFVPNRALSTKLARGVLPQRVPRADAIFNVSRTALWIAAIQSRRWEWLEMAAQDRLHQPYRAKLVRGMNALFDAAMRAGARGVALSGAGPSVIAFADRDVDKIAHEMEQVGVAGKARVVRPSNRGAHLT
jgi:homoserine kinase